MTLIANVEIKSIKTNDLFYHLPGFDKLNKHREGKCHVKPRKLTIKRETDDIRPIDGTTVAMKILVNEDRGYVSRNHFKIKLRTSKVKLEEES